MPTVMKRHVLVNSGRKRRLLTAKQIRFFGTPAQKAALRRKRQQAAANHKPKRRRSRSVARHRQRDMNPGEILTVALGPANPHQKRRKKTNMTNVKRKKRSRSQHRSQRRGPKSSNPVMRSRQKRARRRSRRRRQGNPIVPARPVGMLVSGLTILGGAFATRTVTQIALRGANTGFVGYIGNAIAAGLVGQVLGRAVFRSKQIANMLTLGGFVGLALRMAEDLTPWGKTLRLSGHGDWGMAGFVPQTFFAPLQSAGWPNVMLPGVMERPAAASVSGLGRYGAGRLGSNRLLQ